jgi:hypothetical protein
MWAMGVAFAGMTAERTAGTFATLSAFVTARFCAVRLAFG